MAGDSKKPGTSSAPKETPKEEGGLAPIALLILRKGFRNPNFQEVYAAMTNVSNKIARGDEVSEEELDKVLAVIEAHKKELEKLYDTEVVDIMRNYFLKLAQNLKASYVKAATPKTLEELKKTV